MSKFYVVYPECPAGFEGVEWDTSFVPPRPASAHLLFDAPLFSDLVTSHAGVYAVTLALADDLAATELTGFAFVPLTGELSSYVEAGREFEIPALRALVITSPALAADFGLKGRKRLVLSQRAVDFLTTRDPVFGKYVMDVL
ncbi:hypothetical protein [Nocardia takedensis]|uniref:hypothetical protein n=1 Tax=Nocardia takedensis TaxID=259390 RepID=UPI0002F1F4AB|nr:hypothetical protein [Nocardia takedensis]